MSKKSPNQPIVHTVKRDLKLTDNNFEHDSNARSHIFQLTVERYNCI